MYPKQVASVSTDCNKGTLVLETSTGSGQKDFRKDLAHCCSLRFATGE